VAIKLLGMIFFCFISPILYPKADNFFMTFVIPEFFEESLVTNRLLSKSLKIEVLDKFSNNVGRCKKILKLYVPIKTQK